MSCICRLELHIKLGPVKKPKTVIQDQRTEWITNRGWHSLLIQSTQGNHGQWEATTQPHKMSGILGHACCGMVYILDHCHFLLSVCFGHIYSPYLALGLLSSFWPLLIKFAMWSFDWPGIYPLWCLDNKEEELSPPNSCAREFRGIESDSCGNGCWAEEW